MTKKKTVDVEENEIAQAAPARRKRAKAQDVETRSAVQEVAEAAPARRQRKKTVDTGGDGQIEEAVEAAPLGRKREKTVPVIDFEAVARRGAEGAEDKKATRVIIMHLGDTSPVSDYFVLVSGKTRIQTRAIANGIDEALKDVPVHRTRQGYQAGNWILLDYGGVVFHIFLEREREYYDLEGLYAKAPVIYASDGERA